MSALSTILIIDDEPIARESLEALLAGEGYQLEFATNGPEGLLKAAQVLPDVVLSDVMMPGMDGYEVCRRLRADPMLAEVPILLITALDDRSAKLDGIRAGADDFLSKPFDSLELIARLQSIIRLNRYRHLQVERTRFAWVLEQARDGYVIISDKGHITYTNPQARLYLSLPPNLTPETSFLELARLHYHLEPEATWANWPNLPVGGTTRYLVRPETTSSKSFWLQVKVLQLPDDKNWGRVIQLRDVTDQVTTRHDMRKFHSTLSHKILTPLSHMYNGLETLATNPETLSMMEIKDLAVEAFKGVQRLRDELKDVFQYVLAPSQAKTGQGFMLGHLLSQVEGIRKSLSLENVAVIVPSQMRSWRLALSTKAMDMILLELLENSQKFHPAQKPAIEIEAVAVAAKQVCLQIKDNGLTLSPEQLERVWEPYIQGEKFFTGETAGMGLGLPLVAALVWQVGGAVNLTNRLDGSGVLVTLTLPQAKN